MGIAVVLAEIFLPKDFPDSVTPDYVPYQIFDSLQALCSSVTGMLATRAAFKRAGVGDVAATASAATFQRIMQDGTGMVGQIFFAWRLSDRLDSDLKKFRFLADILNDAAVLLDVISPIVIPSFQLHVACIATLCRALCGVCAGSTKAGLSMHFARNGQVADLNAKDGSQETVVNLIGLLLGPIILTVLPEGDVYRTWFVLVIFTALHLFFNYRAVRAVVIPTLNRQRAAILMTAHITGKGKILSPNDVSQQERILGTLQTDRGILVRWQSNDRRNEPAKTPQQPYTVSRKNGRKTTELSLRPNANSVEILMGYYHAHLVLLGLEVEIPDVETRFKEFRKDAEGRGWKIDTTRSSIA
ncbi:vitamin B6 photo-protection and homoeostasis-domain-containing protein [Cladochytrium replicatum]|nr:vitamin B6 photo-protection and homoeostasis-domain-containing protein [Cladochytrium replicatum]